MDRPSGGSIRLDMVHSADLRPLLLNKVGQDHRET